MRTVWDIPNNKQSEESKYGKHPTQKPLRILDRMIRLGSREGDLVMTPFSGSGSECFAAKLAGRNYLGYETVMEYYKSSVMRLSETESMIQIDAGCCEDSDVQSLVPEVSLHNNAEYPENSNNHSDQMTLWKTVYGGCNGKHPARN
jgi:hypothetical protein